MNDDELNEFIATNRTATRVYFRGLEDGDLRGYLRGHQHAGDGAERAARYFYAMDAREAHTRAFAKGAADALTVPRMAARPMPVSTIKPLPTLAQFLEGLRRGGILRDRQEVAA